MPGAEGHDEIADAAAPGGGAAGASGRSGPGESAREAFGFHDESWMDRLRDAIGPAGRPGDRGDPAALGAIGEYELLERIGQGAQGVVYKARQPRTGRIVAIKRVALADGFDDRARARFQREVELAASLRAEGVVTIHEALADASAIVMEWIDGKHADEWADGFRDQPGATRRIVSACRAACRAVAFAHGRGVIHRDLKPSNILIDAEDKPHVVDFGLAREHGAPPDGLGATLTIAGSFAGTPAYAPPEQLDRGIHEVDVRADVYAMGAVLYRVLTGREPFEAPTLAALFDAVRRGHPASPAAIEPRIDRELSDITLMALRPRPEDRYQTMADFADDLGRWLDRRAVRARRPTALYLARAVVRRAPLQVALAGAALALICALGAAAVVAAVNLARERDRLAATLDERDSALAEAQASQGRATMELYKSRTAVETLYRVLEDLPGSEREIAAALHAQLEAAGQRTIPLRPEIELAEALALARAFEIVGRHGAALATAEAAVAGAREAKVGGADLAEALALLGEMAMREGRFDEAIDAIRETLLISEDDPHAGEGTRAHLMLLEALGGAGRLDEAQAFAGAIPVTPGPAGPFMAARVRALCEQFQLEPPAWVAESR